MTLKGGTSQACAACKYQRKRCTPECALAPHFRPEQTEIFKNAHKLFGVRNILRILEQIDPALKNEAMRSIIYQANMRERSPVFGCLGVIYQLQYQIKQAEREFYGVLSQLEACKQNQRRQQEMITLSSPLIDSSSPESQQLQLGIMLVDQQSCVDPGLTLFQNEVNDDHARHQNNNFVPHVASGFQISYNGNENGMTHDHGYHHNINGSAVINVDSKETMNMKNNNLMWGTQQTYNYHDQINEKSQNMVNSSNMIQPLSFQEEVTHDDYDEIYPFFDTIDDTHSCIDSKEANESSSESSLKESTQSFLHVEGNKFKNSQLQLGIMSGGY